METKNDSSRWSGMTKVLVHCLQHTLLILILSLIIGSAQEVPLVDSPEDDFLDTSQYSRDINNNEVPRELPKHDQCAMINQVQSVVIQILNTHYEYGKGIHMLHNLVDALQDDFSILKTKLDDIDKNLGYNNSKYKDYVKNSVISQMEPTADTLTFKSSADLTRTVQSMHWTLRNITSTMHRHNSQYQNLEKKYIGLRRKVKKIIKGPDFVPDKEGQGSMLDHYMDKQTDINSKLVQRIQALEQRLKVQGDAPYSEHNGGCPSEFVRHFTSCYRFANETLNWINAEKQCQALNPNAHLVSIETSDEAKYLVKYRIHNMEHWSSNYIWTGGNDMTQEDIWRWVGTGSTLGYKNWRPGQPDNHNKDQHCVYFRADGGDPRWDDWHCHAARLNYVCEINMRS